MADICTLETQQSSALYNMGKKERKALKIKIRVFTIGFFKKSKKCKIKYTI